jgi:excinuclease ABC subunit C
MGAMNAQQLLSEQAAVFTTKDRLLKAHQELITALKLDPASTHRLETYDISNIQGTLATASMVVFNDGEAEPKQYRKFRMHLAGTPNDFAMLQETLRRRFGNHSDDAGALNLPAGQAGTKTRWPQPDLIIIDGGKGQLSSAVKVLQELNLTIPIISLAKQEEEIFQPGQKESLRLPYDSEALYLIQRMRDEAHRFTITYHRLLRSKEQRRSLLDEVPGIGPKTKKKLLATFGSLKNIRAAQDAELAKILGEAKTKLLRQYL